MDLYRCHRPPTLSKTFTVLEDREHRLCERCGRMILPRAMVHYARDKQSKRCVCHRSRTPTRGAAPLNIARKELSQAIKRPIYAQIRKVSDSPFSHSLSHQRLSSPFHRTSCLLDFNSDHRYLIVPGNNSKLVGKLMQRRAGWSEEAYPQRLNSHFSWHPESRTVRFDKYVPYLSLQVVNHFEGHAQISNKLCLYRNMKEHCEASEGDIANMMPLTFVLELDSTRFHAQMATFSTYFKAIGEGKGKKAAVPSTHYSGANIWLLKPADLNRGQGISLFSTLDELKELLRDTHSRTPKRDNVTRAPFILQKYIESPYLLDNRKFDIRMWVLVTQDLVSYVYKEGYLRTASEGFTLDRDRLKRNYVHLTNNAVQKNGPLYGRREPGNQLSFAQFQLYLETKGQHISVKKDLFSPMKRLIKQSLLSVQSKLNPLHRTWCFELFGYDFLLDSDLQVWLIEVNTNPCLELSSPLLAQLVPRMLDDALKLTVDKVFPAVYREELRTRQVIELPPGNLWDLVVSLHN